MFSKIADKFAQSYALSFAAVMTTVVILGATFVGAGLLIQSFVS